MYLYYLYHQRTCACANRGGSASIGPGGCVVYDLEYDAWPAAEADYYTDNRALYAWATFLATHDRAQTKLRAGTNIISTDQVSCRRVRVYV